jgi:2-polyprenyl-6-hydroxyphenyl methylase/3-demethylubiquinone-9 3-methyltransferase
MTEELNIEACRDARPYSRKEYLGRVLWAMAGPLFRFSPRPLFAWRRLLLRLFGAQVGAGAHVYPSARVYLPWNLSLGEQASIGEWALVYNLGPVSIGDRATISHRAHLCAGTHDYTDPALPLQRLPIEIGSQAWICADAFVGPGCRIGEGAKRLFEVGCGNGSIASELARRGWDITGVDPSSEGIAQSNRAHPQLKLFKGSAYDDLAGQYGRFPVVLSLEVVEHVYAPREYARAVFSLLEEGGTAIISTPYHGYWKNLSMALSGKMDGPFTALWDHGHIKFWSIKTLSALLSEAGFADIRFERVGRIPALAKSMIAIARKP